MRQKVASIFFESMRAGKGGRREGILQARRNSPPSGALAMWDLQAYADWDRADV